MGSRAPPTWTPPPDQVTRPDQLPAEGWRALELLDGEHVLAVWRTIQGYLVLTNLRCVVVRRTEVLLRPTVWAAGPQFLFYNLRPPRVVLGRFVELAEEYEEQEGGLVSRIAVSDPRAVVAQIAEASRTGRAEWAARRSESKRLMEARRRRREAVGLAVAGGGLSEAARARCTYCGNLVSVSSNRCPNCGAPVG